MINATSIVKNRFSYSFQFSICTIVNDGAEYEVMKKSFEDKGFVDDCEYLFADNTKANQFDAYEAISHFMKFAKGRFIVLVHQDVRAVDERAVLEKCLDKLNAMDENWAICGNAGAKGYHDFIIHLHDGNELTTHNDLPKKVSSLDENFLVIKAASNLTISRNLQGFHLYGTDLCIIAKMLGHTAYVIRYTVAHLSKGNLSALKKYQPLFIDAYGEKLKMGYFQTTCSQFYLSNSSFKNKLLNSPLVFFVVKQFKRYPALIKKLLSARHSKIFL